MTQARTTDEPFERDPVFDLQRYAARSFGTFQENPLDVVLRFDPGRESISIPSKPNRHGEQRWFPDGALRGGGCRGNLLASRDLGKKRDSRRAPQPSPAACGNVRHSRRTPSSPIIPVVNRPGFYRRRISVSQATATSASRSSLTLWSETTRALAGIAELRTRWDHHQGNGSRVPRPPRPGPATPPSRTPAGTPRRRCWRRNRSPGETRRPHRQGSETGVGMHSQDTHSGWRSTRPFHVRPPPVGPGASTRTVTISASWYC